MELRHLRYFVAVAEALNYRAAAERLNVSAPALSKQIRDLESELGVRLLDRDTTGVSLTNAGQVFLPDARQILSDAERAGTKAREAAKGRSGRLVVGNVGPLTAGAMAQCITAFCRRYPEVDLELIDLDPMGQIEALEAHAIDVGFVPGGTRAYLAADIRHVHVLTTPLYIVLHDGHALARERAISFAQLEHERILCISSNSRRLSHRAFLLELFTARGLRPGQLRDVKGLESLLAMVASGQGVSVLAGRPMSLGIDHVVSRAIKDGGKDTRVQMDAIWRPGGPEALARNFIEEFRRVVPKKKRDGEDELGEL